MIPGPLPGAPRKKPEPPPHPASRSLRLAPRFALVLGFGLYAVRSAGGWWGWARSAFQPALGVMIVAWIALLIGTLLMTLSGGRKLISESGRAVIMVLMIPMFTFRLPALPGRAEVAWYRHGEAFQAVAGQIRVGLPTDTEGLAVGELAVNEAGAAFVLGGDRTRPLVFSPEDRPGQVDPACEEGVAKPIEPGWYICQQGGAGEGPPQQRRGRR